MRETSKTESPVWTEVRALSPRIRSLLDDGDIRHAASVAVIKCHLSDRNRLTAEDRRLLMAAQLDGARGAVIAAAMRLSHPGMPVRVQPIPIEWHYVVSRADSFPCPEPT